MGLSVLAAAALIAAASNPSLPDLIWVLDRGYSCVGPDGPVDDLLYDLSTPHDDSVELREFAVQPGVVGQFVLSLGLEVALSHDDYSFTGDVRRDPADWRRVRALRYRRAGRPTDRDGYARLSDELLAVAAGRMKTDELRRSLDTVGLSPCEAVARAWPSADGLAPELRDLWVADVVAAIGDRVSEADRDSVRRLLEVDGRFVRLASDWRPAWMESLVIARVESGWVDRTTLHEAWRFWWPSEGSGTTS